MRTAISIAICLGLSGCVNLAPDYVRPTAPVPAQFGNEATQTTGAPQPKWQELVNDARLKKVIELSLANNRSFRIAALNVEKARAQYRITDAARYPTVTGIAGETTTKSANNISRKYTAELSASYELDFFNRLDNLKDAALENFLSTEASQFSTQISLVTEVTNAWLTLAADQALLQLAQNTLDSRQQTLAIYEKQKALGYVSELILTQQQALAEAARADVSNYKSQVAQARNALVLLAGQDLPNDLLPTDGDAINTQTTKLVDVPEGLSSSVLLQRPDIVAAEHTLKAAYADIGAARAAFFPKITLTALDGSSSTSLGGLFKNGTEIWSFAPQISVPIFNAGSLKASLDSAKITRDIDVATYEYAIQTAFKEVADALAVRSQIGERLQAQKQQVQNYEKVVQLTKALYEKGYDSYLQVLDAQRTLYSAQQSLINLQLIEQQNRITIFKVLGGGGLDIQS